MKDKDSIAGVLCLFLILLIFPLCLWTNFRYQEDLSMKVRYLKEKEIINEDQFHEVMKDGAYDEVTRYLFPRKNYAWSNLGIPVAAVLGVAGLILFIPNSRKPKTEQVGAGQPM